MRKLSLLLLVLATVAPAQDTDAGRGVARLSLLNGDVSVRRGDSGDWTAAAVNAPVVVDDRVSTGPNSRAEIQFDWANMLRLAGQSEVRMRELSERRYLIELGRGLATLTVLRDSEADVDLSTPAVSVRPTRRGAYRVEVLEDGTTEITVKQGEAEIYTPRGTQRLRQGESMQVRGTGDPEFQTTRARGDDDWDRWNRNRDRDLERSSSYKYVHRSVYGADDLDGYGSWESYPEYGNVWVPRVAAGWAPYRYGRWSWVDYYGWSWVSYDPWGWAPFHYGSWFYARDRWCWYPGGAYSRHSWSPGLVAFVGWGGIGIGSGWGRVGWIPLAPYERYNPWYGGHYYGGYRNRTYIDNSVNIVNNVNITNIYRNSRVNNGITGIDADGFSRGRQGGRLDSGELRNASLTRGLVPVTPGRESGRFSDRDVRRAENVASRFDREGGQSRFISRQAPRQVERASFDDQRRGVEATVRGRYDNDAGQRVARDGVTREAQGRAGGESAGQGIGRGDGSVDRNVDRGVNRGSDRGVAQNGDRSGDTGGWRRFGEPVNRESRGMEGRPSRGVNRNMESSSTPDSGGWRRFGEPRTRDAVRESRPDASGMRPGENRVDRAPVERNRVERSSEDGGWRRFGEGSSRQQTPVDRGGDRGRIESQPNSERPPMERRNEQRMEPRTEQRFEPRNEQRFEPRNEQRMEPRNEQRFAPRNEQRFEPRSEPRIERQQQQQQRFEAPRMEQPRFERSQPRFDRGDSVRVAPPMVQERSAPRMERSAPRMEAPRMEAPRGGGGGASVNRGGGGGGGRPEGRGGGRNR